MIVKRKTMKKTIKRKLDEKGPVAVPLTMMPQIILEPFKLPVKKRKLEQVEESFLLQEHKVACQLIGYFQIPDTITSCPTGKFIPTTERKRQLAGASNRKQQILQKKWGLEDSKSTRQKRKEKQHLRTGKASYDFIKTVRHDNPRSLELATRVSLQLKPEADGEEPEVDKKLIKVELKKKIEQKKQNENIKRAINRKQILQRVAAEKKEKKASMLKSACLVYPTAGMSDPTAAVKDKQPSMAPESSQFVFNITDTSKGKKPKKKKRTIEQLKEELKARIQKKKMLSALQETGEDDLAQKVLNKQGWAEAVSKIHGEKVDTISYITRDLKRAQSKESNRYKKYDEVLDRQKLAKHKILMRRQQNMRERRVQRLAKKMKRFAKKGHIVPGFM